MFESRLVDRFSRTHWAAVPILYLPALGVLLGVAAGRPELSAAGIGGLVALGFVSWTLAEYLLHRFVFHWVPRGRWGERMHFLLHGVHHRWPRDRYRLVMPPAFSGTLFFVFLGLFALLLGWWALPFHAGFVAGYVVYDLTHYYVHHGSPRGRWMKAIRRHHLAHHSPRLEHAGKFGVSSTLWDHVFRTY